jgi:hypothetical protein
MTRTAPSGRSAGSGATPHPHPWVASALDLQLARAWADRGCLAAHAVSESWPSAERRPALRPGRDERHHPPGRVRPSRLAMAEGCPVQ